MDSLVIYKKELKEYIKTSRLIIITSLFLFFAIMSPLIAKYIPLIIKLADEQAAFIPMPEPTYTDAFIQLYKNMTSFIFIIIIFMLCGTVAREKDKGIISLIVTKGLSRNSIIIGKFLAHICIYTIIYIISCIIFYIYTITLFPQNNMSGAFLSLAIFWLYGIFIISGIILASTLAKSYSMAVLYSFIIYILSSITASIPHIKYISPAYSTTISLELVQSNAGFTKDMLPLIISILVLTIIFVLLSIICFRKQEL